MSEVTTPDVPTTEGTDTAGDVLDTLTDVRVVDRDGFRTALDSLLAVAKAAAREYVSYQKLIAKVAQARVEIRTYMLLPSGFPDWAGASNGYKAAVESAEFALYVKLGPDGKRKLDQAVRQSIKRTHLLNGVVSYVLRTTNGLAEESARFHGDEEKGIKPDPDAIMSNPSDALVAGVRHHYAMAGKDGLTLPAGTAFAIPYQAGDGNDPGPGKTDPPSAIAALEIGLGGLAQIVPDVGVSGLLRASSDVSKRLVDAKGSEIKNRPAIISQLERVAEIAFVTAKLLKGDGSEADEAKLSEYYWTKSDTPKLDPKQDTTAK